MREQQPLGEQTPLESWKEIAAYLQKDQTTVRRWEKREGLPVHRHVHRSRASVYAYASELDSWREGRKPDGEPESEPERMALWGSPWSSVATATLLLLALLWVGNTASEVQAQGLSDSGVIARQFELSDAAKEASVSPWNVTADGRYLGATDYKTNNAAIVDISTGEYRVVSHYNPSGGEPGILIDEASISHDGGRIAYWHFLNSDDVFGNLRVIDQDGTNEQVLYEDPCGAKICDWGMPKDWSPDGHWVLTLLEHPKNPAGGPADILGTADIVMVPSHGGEPRTLISYEYVRRYRPNIRFSPDGRYVAYDYPPELGMAEGDLYVLPVEGGEPVVIAPHPARDQFLSWTPDGNLLFQSERGPNMGMYQVPIQGGQQAGEPVLLRPDLQVRSSFGFGADAYFYATTSQRLDARVARVDFTGRRVLEQPAPISERFAEATAYASFSPDGTKAAYVHTTSPKSTIVIRDLESGIEREILPDVQFGQASRLRWHADGEHLLGQTAGADQNGLYQLDVHTGAAQLIYAHNGAGFNFDWTPDARFIYRIVNQQLIREDLQTGVQTTPFTAEYTLRNVSVSPDGQKVAVGRNDNDVLLIVNVDGREPATIHMNRPTWGQNGNVWTPDSNNVLFLGDRDGDAGWPIWIAPIRPELGSPEFTGLRIPNLSGSIAMHPDGQQVTFTVQNRISEAWVMENFLPDANSGN